MTSEPTIAEIEDGLFLIDLDLSLEGFRKFISCWLYRAGESVVLVDPGPRATYPRLGAALERLGVARIDGVLLTHIHIDHAGSAGLLSRDFPGTRMLCHPMAFDFLVEPSRLWESSRKVLGEVAEAYGSIEPVPRSALEFADESRIGALRVAAIETPGHAPHHACYLVDGLLFAGEALGNFARMEDGSIYLRPATPPTFDRETFLRSQERLRRLPVRRICFAHYGSCGIEDWDWDLPRLQVEAWLDLIEEAESSGLARDEEGLIDRLLRSGPFASGYASMPPDIRARERLFSRNSLRGMRAYLRDRRRI